MGTEEMSQQLDPAKSGQVFLSLLMTSIAEARALQKLLVQQMSDSNPEVYQKLMQQVKKTSKDEYEKLKEETFANYGKLPPDLFGNEKGST